jgi:hypothetical protein
MNGEREPRDTGRNHDAGWRFVWHDNAPTSCAPEARDSTPGMRRDPNKMYLEPVTSDVRVGVAGIAGDRRDDTEDVSPGCDGDESQVETESLLAPHGDRDSLPCGWGRVAGGDRDAELGRRGGAHD